MLTHLQTDDVLSVDLTDVVLGEKAISGSRAILHQRSDTAKLIDETDVAGAVFVHGDGALERSVSRTG